MFIRFIFLVFLLLIPRLALALDEVTLQLRWLHQAQFAGYYMAEAKGFYQDAGIGITILPGGNANTDPLHQVLNGQADFGVGNTEVLVAYGQGLPLTAIAAIFQHSPSILLARADRDIQTIHDLKNKRVMMFSGAADAELISLLSHHHIKLNDLKQITTSANIDDLLNDKVDVFNGYLTNEPYYLTEQGIDPIIFSPSDYGIDFYSDVLFTQRQLAEQRPDLVERFRQASINGWYYALMHIDETVDYILANYPTTKSREHLIYELTQSASMIMADLIEIGHMNPKRWQHIANQLAQLNIIPSTQIDQQFLFSLRKKSLNNTLNFWQQSGIVLLLILALLAGYLYYANRRLKNKVDQHKLAEQHAAHMARIDNLTGIANRYALLEELHRTVVTMRPNQSHPALLFIDLDDFKAVNDTYGHQAGDKVLQQFCYRVNSTLTRTDSFFARLAGDEFVILLRTTSKSAANELTATITQQATKPFIVGKDSIRIGASVGTTFYRNGDTPDYFLSRADSKMYRNKKRSRQERFNK